MNYGFIIGGVLIFGFPTLGGVLLSACLAAKSSERYNSAAITERLEERAFQIDSYAQDYVVQGEPVKRMFFLFKKDGKDYYTFRSDYVSDSRRLIRLFNVDGKFDYDYLPQDNLAFRRETTTLWNDENYDRAKNWHFDYSHFLITGEKTIHGVENYVLDNGDTVLTVRKDLGIQTSSHSRTSGKTIEYKNFEFQLKPDIFVLPLGVQIIVD